jgi:DNA-binding transcriptional regulator LsrR (DeoR family)
MRLSITASDYERLLVKVARLYYEQELTQHEIGERLHISRQKIQRLLRQARDDGVVQITIRPVIGAYTELENELEQSFGLREVVIVETTAFEDQQLVQREVGAGAAEYLLRVIRPGQKIVISWGGTLLGMVNALYADPKSITLPKLKVIQGLGGLGDPNKEVHAVDLTKRLAQKFGGQAILLPTPGVAGSLESRDAFYSDPHVQQVLDQGRTADLAIMGIGVPRPDSILIREGEIVKWPELEVLRAQGAVGDINLRFFNQQGTAVVSDLDTRVIGLTLDEIREIDQVIGIAAGAVKVQAIQGALMGRLIDVLVTDHCTAQEILTN